VDFPNNIFFRLGVDWRERIERIVLRYKTERETPFEEFADAFPPFLPGKRVEVEWRWDLRRVGGLPPGAVITYRWLITDSRGSSWSTRARTLVFDDPRFDWREISASGIAVFWYRGSREFSRKLLEAARKATVRIEEELGLPLKGDVRLYIYEDSLALQGARVFPQQWEGGVAFPDYRTIVLAVSPRNLAWGERAVAHELSHFAVHYMVFPYIAGLPNWLNEGLAMYAEGDLSPGMAEALKKAAAGGGLLSVKSLASSFPPDPELARLAYAQSYSLVAFLIELGGPAGMRALLEVFGRGADPDEALERVYGFDVRGLEMRWRQGLGLALSPRREPRPLGSPS